MRRRGDWRPGFGQRFAIYDASLKQALTNRHVIWLHAVSVGEVNLCTQLIQRARTARAQRQNRRLLHHHHRHGANCAAGCRRTSARFIIRWTAGNSSAARWPPSIPKAIMLVEAEIWPNFLWRAQRTEHPGVSGERAAVRPLVSALQKIRLPVPAAVRVVRRRRLPERGGRRSGCAPSAAGPKAVQVVGNLKFDAAKLTERSSLDVRGDAAPARRAGRRADPRGRQHARRRGNYCWPTWRGGCGRNFRNCF